MHRANGFLSWALAAVLVVAGPGCSAGASAGEQGGELRLDSLSEPDRWSTHHGGEGARLRAEPAQAEGQAVMRLTAEAQTQPWAYFQYSMPQPVDAEAEDAIRLRYRVVNPPDNALWLHLLDEQEGAFRVRLDHREGWHELSVPFEAFERYWTSETDSLDRSALSAFWLYPHEHAGHASIIDLAEVSFVNVAGRLGELEHVRVDFADAQGALSGVGSGFLHSISADRPAEEYVQPLRPQLFRVRAGSRSLYGERSYLFAEGFYDRLRAMDAAIQAGPAGTYSGRYLEGEYMDEGPQHPWPGDDGDFQKWESLLEELVLRVQAFGLDVQWDIWNEPDHETYWKRDREQFFQTWKRAVRTIRGLDPQAEIVGPSLAEFCMDYLPAFLRYAQEHDVLPDVLSWHELRDRDARAIPQRVALIERFMAEEGIELDRISLNEYTPEPRQLWPGTAVSYLGHLEAAEVESAAKSCWREPDGLHNCWNESLDGLLTHPDRHPRAIWWVFRHYADLHGQRVRVASENNGFIHGLASYDAEARTAGMLLGNWSQVDIPDAQIQLDSVGEALRRDGQPVQRVHVHIERIPHRGTEAVDEPETIVSQAYELDEGGLSLEIPLFGSGEAYALTLEPAAEH